MHASCSSQTYLSFIAVPGEEQATTRHRLPALRPGRPVPSGMANYPKFKMKNAEILNILRIPRSAFCTAFCILPINERVPRAHVHPHVPHDVHDESPPPDQ